MTRNLSILWLMVFLVACGAKTKQLDTDTGTLAEAERLLDSGFYDAAREQLFRIKTEFVSSPLHVQADLKLAESYFRERSWKAAASAYEDFIRTYPGNQEVPFALYKLGKSHVRQMPSNPERDTRSTERVLDVFSRLLVEFPDSEYAQQAIPYIERAQGQLAEKGFRIARFYERSNNPLAAANRFQEVFYHFPDHPRGEESLARRVRNLRKAGQEAEAEAAAKTFRETFPGSNFRSMIE